MESNSSIDKKKIDESLKNLLNLFDESEAILKGIALPTKPIQKNEYNLNELVENIADGKVSLIQENSSKEIGAPSASDDDRMMAGLSLSERLKAKLNASKSQNSNFEPNRGSVSNKTTSKNNSFNEKSFSSRLASNQKTQNNLDSNINNLTNKNYQKQKSDNIQIGNNVNLTNSTYNELHDYVMNCTHCPECSNRQNVLFGEGKIPSRLIVIGEGPGKNEDSTGRLFVGPSGVFLDKWLAGIHLNMRDDVYLSNIVKCFSGTNPTLKRANYCKIYLEKQIDFVKPEAILVLGKVAANSLLNNELPLNQMRERVLNYKGIPVVVTYHPAAVLRNEQWKRPVWNDLKQIASILNIDLQRR